MQRYEMDRSADLLFSQRVNELVAIDSETLQIQLNDKQMPSVLDVLPAHRDLDFFELGKGFLVNPGDALSGLPELVAFLQLFDADGSRNIRQIVLEPGVENFVVPGTFLRVTFPGIMADAMETHHSHPLGPFRIVCCCHSAFAGGDGFRGVKGKAGDIADRAYGADRDNRPAERAPHLR